MFNFSKKFRFKLEPLTDTLYQYLAQGAAGTTPPLEKLIKQIQVRKEMLTFTI